MRGRDEFAALHRERVRRRGRVGERATHTNPSATVGGVVSAVAGVKRSLRTAGQFGRPGEHRVRGRAGESVGHPTQWLAGGEAVTCDRVEVHRVGPGGHAQRGLDVGDRAGGQAADELGVDEHRRPLGSEVVGPDTHESDSGAVEVSGDRERVTLG